MCWSWDDDESGLNIFLFYHKSLKSQHYDNDGIEYNMKSKFEIPLREDIAFDLQVFCRDNFDRLKRIHRHFIKEIESYASLDHIDLLRCLRMMSNSY